VVRKVLHAVYMNDVLLILNSHLRFLGFNLTVFKRSLFLLLLWISGCESSIEKHHDHYYLRELIKKTEKISDVECFDDLGNSKAIWKKNLVKSTDYYNQNIGHIRGFIDMVSDKNELLTNNSETAVRVLLSLFIIDSSTIGQLSNRDIGLARVAFQNTSFDYSFYEDNFIDDIAPYLFDEQIWSLMTYKSRNWHIREILLKSIWFLELKENDDGFKDYGSSSNPSLGKRSIFRNCVEKVKIS